MLNLFEFNSEYFLKLIGSAMGAVPAVSYANIYMARKKDSKILAVAEKFKNSDGNPVSFIKRFLDALVMIWLFSKNRKLVFNHFQIRK